jgi:hypothetical protein
MKLALFYNLKFAKMYINLRKYVIWTLCQICLFELIWIGGGGAKFMKQFNGGASYKSLETSAIGYICFSCSPPEFKLIKITPVVDAADLILPKLPIKQSEIQNSAVCLKPPPIIITSSLSHYSYQKDERA